MEGGESLSLQEAIRVQLDEMELVEMAYPELVFDQPDPRPLLRAALDEWDAGQPKACSSEVENEISLQGAVAGLSLISFRCPLSSEATLRIRLPRYYPLKPLTTKVDGTPLLSPSVRAKILAASNEEAKRLSGASRREPHCLQVLSEATLASSDDSVEAAELTGDQIPEQSRCSPNAATGNGAIVANTLEDDGEAIVGERLAPTLAPGTAAAANNNGKECREARKGMTNASRKSKMGSNELIIPGVLLGRRLIYSHHIINPQKRTGILRSARELGLGGYSKIGWPGVIVVEGEESACEEFVRVLRTWRWKHLAVRGEETQRVAEGRTIDQERRLPPAMEELSEKDGVSALAKLCKTAGLGDLFTTLLR